MSKMRSWFFFLAMAAAACAGEGSKDDADVQPEPDADIPDEPDLQPDPDVVPDPDVEPDPDLVDTAEDPAEELPDCSTIEALRTRSDGVVDVNLCPAIVTYVYFGGYFIQAGASGPAIQVFEGDTWTPDVEVGDEIEMHVTSLTTFFGTREIDGHGPVAVLSTGNDAEALAQDLSAGTLPSEDLESELVRVTLATVTLIDGRVVTASYGTAAGVRVLPMDSGLLCLGSTFSVLAVVTEDSGASVHQIRSFSGADFYAVSAASCGGTGRAPAAGELLINEFLADPADGLAGDANCDGVRDPYDDEFIELVNVSSATLLLAGVTVADTSYVRHTFAPGTDLAPGKAIVVFGGGTPGCTAWPSDVQVVEASTGVTGLDNDGETLTLTGATGTLLLTVTYGAEASWNESMTLSPDLDDEDAAPTTVAGYERHGTADTADGSPHSPGTRIDGSPF
jgi:hypothetical protein